MNVHKIGDYLKITKDGKTLAIVDFRNKNNPTISISSTITLWDLRGVVYHIEQHVQAGS
jgi:hypothetical protein